jgi:hypothetical protein
MSCKYDSDYWNTVLSNCFSNLNETVATAALPQVILVQKGKQSDREGIEDDFGGGYNSVYCSFLRWPTLAFDRWFLRTNGALMSRHTRPQQEIAL